MKTTIIRLVGLLLFLSVNLFRTLVAQDLPPVLQRVLDVDTTYNKLSCTLEIELDIPGLNMPNKEVYLELEKDKKPKIKSKGLILIPKRGLIGQYSDLLNVPSQTILMESKGDTTVYKVVSLDNTTDWVTVDFKVTETDAKIHSQIISTRKNGVYEISHVYGEDQSVFPEMSMIQFEAMPVKLPLKFIGKSTDTGHLFNDDGPISGKVYLYYSELKIE